MAVAISPERHVGRARRRSNGCTARFEPGEQIAAFGERGSAEAASQNGGWRSLRLRPAASRRLRRASRCRAGRCRRAARPVRSARRPGALSAARSPAAATDASADESSGTGSPGRNTASRAAAAAPPAACGSSGVPPKSSARMPKRSSSALTRRASSRSAVTRAAVLPPLDDRAAERHRDRQRLVALVGGFDQGHAGKCARRAAPSGTPARATAQSSVVSAGRSASRERRAPERRRWSRQASPMSATSRRDADLADQLGQAELRMAEHRRLRASPRNAPTMTLVERAVEAGQHHGAVRQAARSPTSSSAVAGIEPVEPAAITGPAPASGPAAPPRRRISALRCAAGLDRSRSARTAGQARVTISRKFERHLPPAREAAGTRSPAWPSPRLRSRSRRSARRGRAPARSRRPPRPARSPLPRTCAATWPAACASRRAPAAPAAAAARAARSAARDRARPDRPARRHASSSSNSPSGRITGRIGRRPPRRSAKTLRNSRAARRVGTKMVASASASGSPSQAKSGNERARQHGVGERRQERQRRAGSKRRAGCAVAHVAARPGRRRRPLRRAGSRPACRR